MSFKVHFLRYDLDYLIFRTVETQVRNRGSVFTKAFVPWNSGTNAGGV